MSVFRLQFPSLVWYKPHEAAEKPLWNSFSDASSIGACKVYQIRRLRDFFIFLFFFFLFEFFNALDSFRVAGELWFGFFF